MVGGETRFNYTIAEKEKWERKNKFTWVRAEKELFVLVVVVQNGLSFAIQKTVVYVLNWARRRNDEAMRLERKQWRTRNDIYIQYLSKNKKVFSEFF